MAKSPALAALDFLTKPRKHPVARVSAVYGDEAFLKREVLTALRRQALGDADGAFSLTVLEGKQAEWRDVRDALATVSLFGSGRPMVIVEEADPFVSRHRSELENYVSRPASGVLVLEVKTWPANTRLAKAVAASGLAIECKQPTEARAKRWLGELAKNVYGKRLEPAAVDELWDLLPPEVGILQQEVAKLALLAGEESSIDLALVRDHVGGWRTRTAWEMVDAIAAGNAGTALEQLQRLLAAGEQPIGLLAQMAGTLRRFANATQLVELAEREGRRTSLSAALGQAGVRPFKLGEAERQLRQIGRTRAKQLHDWLLAADLAMKGHNSSPARARIELERLIVLLSTAVSGGPPVADVRI
jgi:DNA polymerase-3 subunit delta